ncbi:MAG: hypothetical protein AMXMBFR47_02800 [Planctomycetota bacterium]
MLPNRTFSARMPFHANVNIHALAALLWCVTAFTPPASADGPLEVVGQWGGGSWSVLADGNVAYAGVGPNLYVLDIADPAHPVRIASLRLTDRLYEIHRLGQYLVIANGRGGLQIVDVSNPLAPQRVAALSDRPCRSVAISGSTAYLFDQYVRVVDIADPANPTVLGEVDSGLYPGELKGAFVQIAAGDDGYAYIAGPLGLTVLDARNPAQPTLLDALSTFGSGAAASVVGERLVVAFQELLVIFDLGDPANPAIQGSLGDPLFYPYTMTIDGEIAYLAHVSMGPAIVDISDPAAPRFLGEIETQANSMGMSAQAGRLFIASHDGGVFAIDASDPAHPLEVGRFSESTGQGTGIAVVGDLAYMTVRRGALRVFDVSQPENPAVIGTAALPGTFRPRLTAIGDRLYVADGTSGVGIADISNPAHITSTTWYPGLISPRMLVKGDSYYSYLVGGGYSLDMLTVRPRANSVPELRGGCPLSNSATVGAIAAGGDYLVVATNSGLSIVDVHLVVNPFEVASHPNRDIDDLIVIGNHVIAVGDGISSIDISNPLEPVVVGGSDRDAHRIAASGRYVVAVDHAANELLLLNVQYPTAPRIVASIPTNGDSENLAVEGNVAYVADGEGGLLIVRLPDPADFNFDGHVDTTDLTTLLSNFGIPAGAAWWQGDVDEDGDVDLSDLVSLLGAFGR